MLKFSWDALQNIFAEFDSKRQITIEQYVIVSNKLNMVKNLAVSAVFSSRDPTESSSTAQATVTYVNSILGYGGIPLKLLVHFEESLLEAFMYTVHPVLFCSAPFLSQCAR